MCSIETHRRVPNPNRLFSSCLVAAFAFLMSACGGGGPRGSGDESGTQEPETTYTVTLSESPNRSGTLTGDGNYTAETMVTVTANARDGYVFENWTDSGSVVSTDPQFQFEVDRVHYLIASFKLAPNLTRVPAPSEGIAVKFEVAPGDLDTLYAITEEATIGDGSAGIWRSNDSGATWTKVLSGNASFVRVGSGDSNLILTAIGGTYYFSTDGGDTWTSDTIPDPVSGNPVSLKDAPAVINGTSCCGTRG